MNPSLDSTFWGHFPPWTWWIIVPGILGLFIFEGIRGSEKIAGLFGTWGRRMYGKGLPKRMERIEALLERTSDRLECATAYLVIDADYHHHTDIIIAERCPGVTQLLPKRMPYTEFSRLWQEGWRP